MNYKHITYKHVEYNTLYTVAPQGSILCKAIGGTKWIPSKMGLTEFNKAIDLGYMIKVSYSLKHGSIPIVGVKS